MKSMRTSCQHLTPNGSARGVELHRLCSRIGCLGFGLRPIEAVGDRSALVGLEGFQHEGGVDSRDAICRVTEERIRECLVTRERRGSDAGDVVVLAGHDLQLADSWMGTKKLFEPLADDGR